MSNADGAVDQGADSMEGGANGADSAEQQPIDTQEGSSVQENANAQQQDLPVELQEKLKEKEKELMRGFHEKTQALAAEQKLLEARYAEAIKDQQTLHAIAGQEWFRNAAQGEKAKRSGVSSEITREQFDAIKDDPRAFQDFLRQRDESVAARIEAKFEQKLQGLSKSQQELLTSREFDAAVDKFGEDFQAAVDSKALAPYLKDYDYATAYKLYCQDHGKVAGKRQAPSLDAAQRRSASVEKPGMSQHRGGPTVKAKNLDDALNRTFELLLKGQKDFRVER